MNHWPQQWLQAVVRTGPGLAAFDFTVDDSDSNTVLDSAVVFWRRAMMPRMYDQLSIEEGDHSTTRLGTLSSKLG